MGDTQHTPGPRCCIAKRKTAAETWAVWNEKDELVAQVCELRDAQRIALAPEMLEALRPFAEAAERFAGRPKGLLYYGVAPAEWARARSILDKLEG